MKTYSAAMRKYMQEIDRAMMYCVRYAPPKNVARQVLREQDHIWIEEARPILNRWWRRYAHKHPMGKFFWNRTKFEEPRSKKRIRNIYYVRQPDGSWRRST